MKPILFTLAFFTASLTNAQTLFTQGFNGGTNVANLINFGTTTNGQFNGIGPVYGKAYSDTFKAGASIVLRDTKKLQLKTRQDTSKLYFTRKYLGYSYDTAFTIYGAIINNLKNAGVRPLVANRLGSIFIRSSLFLKADSTWEIDEYKAGFKIVLNANWENNADPPSGVGHPVQYPDSTSYRNALVKLLDTFGFKPVMIVVENEEANAGYHSGSCAQYVNELIAGVNVGHARGYKVTNGGLTAEALRWCTWKHYHDSASYWSPDSTGSTHKDYTKWAYWNKLDTGFFNRTTATNNKGGDTHYNNTGFVNGIASRTDTLIKAYKTVAIDYVNFHWYAGEKGADTSVLNECKLFLETTTGKRAMTNEIGQYNSDSHAPQTVDSVLAYTYSTNFPVVIWYDGDATNGGQAYGLNDKSGNLRPNGQHFRDFLSVNGLSYKAPQFLSVAFKINVPPTSIVAPGADNKLIVGTGLTVDTAPTVSDSIHSQIALLFANYAQHGGYGFRLKNPLSGELYPAIGSNCLTTEQVVKWYVNNSGAVQSYTGPDNNVYSIGNDSFEVFIAPSNTSTWAKAFTNSTGKAATSPGVLLNDLKFVLDSGYANVLFDSVTVVSEATGLSFPMTRTDLTQARLMTTKQGQQRLLVSSPGNNNQVRLFLHSPVPDKAQLFIFDMNGRQRATGRLNITAGENVYTFPVLLGRGIYFIKVQTDNGVLIQKFIQ